MNINFNAIKNFFKGLSNKFIVILTLLLITIFSTAGLVYKCDRDKINILEQNFKASKDTIEVLKMNNGDLLYEKSSYILKEKELINQLDITKKELEDIKKKVGNPVFITDIKTVIKYDTIQTTKDSLIYVNNNIKHLFEYKSQWLTFHGESFINDSISNTNIFDINIPAPLIVGLTKDYKIFVESRNPYLTITDIDGAVINQNLITKTKRFSHGISLGFGITYGLINKKIDIGPQISYGLHFNF